MTPDHIGSQPEVNNPNLVMRPFDLRNGLFSISVLTKTYFIEHTLARVKQAQRSH